MIPVAFIERRVEKDNWGNDVSLVHVCDRKYPYRMVHFKEPNKRYQHCRVYGGHGKFIAIYYNIPRSDNEVSNLKIQGLEFSWGDCDFLGFGTDLPEWFKKLPDIAKEGLERLGRHNLSYDETIAYMVSIADMYGIWEMKKEKTNA